MFHLVLTVLRVLGSGFQPRRHLLLDNLALRRHFSVLQRPVRKPRLRIADRFLWVLLQQFWSGWHRSLVLVQPRTVVGWHRLGFRLFWRWKSRARSGRLSVDRQLITVTRQMWSGNGTWGSKRIQAELAKPGIQVAYDAGPVAKGGLSVSTNLVFACLQCDQQKSDITLAAFLRAYKLDRQTAETRLANIRTSVRI